MTNKDTAEQHTHCLPNSIATRKEGVPPHVLGAAAAKGDCAGTAYYNSKHSNTKSCIGTTGLLQDCSEAQGRKLRQILWNTNTAVWQETSTSLKASLCAVVLDKPLSWTQEQLTAFVSCRCEHLWNQLRLKPPSIAAVQTSPFVSSNISTVATGDASCLYRLLLLRRMDLTGHSGTGGNVWQSRGQSAVGCDDATEALKASKGGSLVFAEWGKIESQSEQLLPTGLPCGAEKLQDLGGLLPKVVLQTDGVTEHVLRSLLGPRAAVPPTVQAYIDHRCRVTPAAADNEDGHPPIKSRVIRGTVKLTDIPLSWNVATLLQHVNSFFLLELVSSGLSPP
eukprot:Lankesteria_metandrocarpae@DN7142_c0_g1_i3.p1